MRRLLGTSRLRLAALAFALGAIVACETSPDAGSGASGASPVAAARTARIARGPFVSWDAWGDPTVDVVAVDSAALVLALPTGETYPFVTVDGPRRRATITRRDPPGTRLAYSVRAGEKTVASSVLSVATGPRSRLDVAAVGDSGKPFRGKPGPDQLAVARVLDAITPDLVIHVGDVVYDRGEAALLDPLFFRPYADALSRVPYFCCLGNHDTYTEKGKPELTSFPYPPGAERNDNRWYSFDAGPVHFTVLDSNPIAYGNGLTTASFLATPQGRWLLSDLASAPRDKWKVCYFHHPLYSCNADRGKQTSALSILEPVLQDGGVDLVVTGHDHFYHRTERVLRGKRDASGIYHVVSGGGGAELYDGRPDPDYTESFHRRHGLVRFRFDGDRATVEALAPAEGAPEVLDAATLTRKTR